MPAKQARRTTVTNFGATIASAVRRGKRIMRDGLNDALAKAVDLVFARDAGQDGDADAGKHLTHLRLIHDTERVRAEVVASLEGADACADDHVIAVLETHHARGVRRGGNPGPCEITRGVKAEVRDRGPDPAADEDEAGEACRVHTEDDRRSIQADYRQRDRHQPCRPPKSSCRAGSIGETRVGGR